MAVAKHLGLPAFALNMIMSRRNKVLLEAGNISTKCKEGRVGGYDEIEQSLML